MEICIYHRQSFTRISPLSNIDNNENEVKALVIHADE